MKALIIEPHGSGHHGPYLVWMASGLVKRRFDVTVITFAKTAEHPSLQMLDQMTVNNDGKVSMRLIMGESSAVSLPSGSGATGSLIARELAYWRLFRAWYRNAINVQPDVVFLPYVDYCLHAIGLLGSPFGSCPWVGLTMRPSFHYHRMNVIAPRPTLSGIKKELFFRVLRNRYLKKLLTIDEPLSSYLQGRGQFSTKVYFFPEPADLGSLPAASVAKRQFGLSTTRKVILLYGSVTARKGVKEILEALAVSNFPATVDILLAGKIVEPAIQKVLDEHWVRDLSDQGRIKIIDRFIKPTEEPALFAAADIVWIGYRGHYNSSGLLVQAANAKRPVLACEEGVIGWQTRRHNLGRVVNPGNAAEVIAAIKCLLEDSPGKKNNDGHVNLWHPPSFGEAQEMLARVLRNN